MTRYSRLLGLAALVAAAGCSAEKPNTVTGKVTLNGKEVSSGQIRFVPVNKDTATANAMIENGRYTANNVPLTTHKVIITSPQKVGPEEGEPQVRETIPVEYNDSTELTVTISAGMTELNFELKGEPPAAKKVEPKVDDKKGTGRTGPTAKDPTPSTGTTATGKKSSAK